MRLFIFAVMCCVLNACGQSTAPAGKETAVSAETARMEKATFPLRAESTVRRNDDGSFTVSLKLSCSIELTNVKGDLDEVKGVERVEGDPDCSFDTLPAGSSKELEFTLDVIKHRYLRYQLSIVNKGKTLVHVHPIKIPHPEQASAQEKQVVGDDKAQEEKRRPLKLNPATPK